MRYAPIDAGAAAGLSHVHVKEIEDGVTAPSFDKVMLPRS